MMILIGGALSTGFVFALRAQINARQLGQAEERLKAKLDEYANQQKFLALDQQRALSADESERAGKQGGLNQLKLDQPRALRNTSIQKVAPRLSAPVKPSQAGQQNRVGKQPAKNSQAAKSPAKNPALKTTAMNMKLSVAKAKKEGVKRQQVSQSQRRR